MGNVYLMHGNDGQYSKAMWSDLMVALANNGYSSLACDQRGFSVGAAPSDERLYNYNFLVSDMVAIVNQSFGTDSKIHLVTHDQG